MKRKISFFVGCLFLLVGCGKTVSSEKTNLVPEKNSTKKFFNQDGQFRILFEAEPTAYSQYVPFETGKILLNTFIYEKGINLIYSISYADYPESFINGKEPDDLLNDLLENYINTQKAGLEIQKLILINNWPGIYFKASNSDTFVYGEYILKKNRLYQLMVTKEGNYHTEPEVNAFLQSLELL